jgi:hypothetical protein
VNASADIMRARRDAATPQLDATRARLEEGRARTLGHRPGFVPGLCGALLLLQLFVLRLVASATSDSVTFAGRTLDWGCWLREHFGVACPFCGLTRGTLLTLQGQLAPALQLNPAGPLLVVGLCALALALISLSLCARLQGDNLTQRAQRWLRGGALTYAGLFVVVLFGHWLAALR